jgi:hypothetical protein
MSVALQLAVPMSCGGCIVGGTTATRRDVQRRARRYHWPAEFCSTLSNLLRHHGALGLPGRIRHDEMRSINKGISSKNMHVIMESKVQSMNVLVP